MKDELPILLVNNWKSTDDDLGMDDFCREFDVSLDDIELFGKVDWGWDADYIVALKTQEAIDVLLDQYPEIFSVNESSASQKKKMSYLMMKINGWDRGETAVEPTTKEVCEEFNLAANEIDRNFGVVFVAEGQHAVMVSVEAAKKMLAKHVDNTVEGKGPFVEGPFSSPTIQPV